MTLIRIHILFVLGLLLALAPIASRAEESLFDPSNARKLDTTEVKAFGPQSGRFRYDKTMLNAARIAADRARAHSTSSCWRYVKNALLAAKTIDSYPDTVYAKQAGDELTKDYGFKRLSINDPYAAPLGSVIVYGGRGAGHVEIRTATGFVSDFESLRPSPRPLLGVFVKPRT
ncbi:MAG TPA: hypothetical protein VFD27_04540 [Chthoniobacteraceae bacterium]|jgi:hypothetical protein|nr:hypothetical protein [Chthoniobacteraceae bacterium]